MAVNGTDASRRDDVLLGGPAPLSNAAKLDTAQTWLLDVLATACPPVAAELHHALAHLTLARQEVAAHDDQRDLDHPPRHGRR